MRKIAVMDTRTIVIGRVGENDAAQVVWPGLLAKWRGLYGEGTVQLAVRRPLDKSPYPAVCEVSGDDVTWTVSAADTAQHGTGECELSYLVGDTVAKSQTWAAMILRSLTGDEPGEPPEAPEKAWFAAIQSQIGDLADLTTKAKDNLVAAINEAAKSGSGGGGSVEMRVAGGYIQYSTDGETWENLIAVADLKGDTGPQGPKGGTGAAGQDGYSPSASVTETDDGAEISITDKTGTTTATVKNGKDGAGMDLTGATVGQIAKIAAVDESGKPTAWEPVDMARSSNPFEKVVEMTTAEDAAVISISTDKNGNPLSMSEFYVAITTARNSAATANKNFNCNVLPDTVPSHIRERSAIKSAPMYSDVYCYVMHYKVMGGIIFNEYSGKRRTASGLNVAEYIENEKTIGIAVGSGETIGFLSPTDASTGESKIDASGKMYCITFSADSTECIFGAGTRVEVWAR